MNFTRRKRPHDDTEFLNYMPQYTDGYRRGKIVDIKQGKRRIGIVFLPSDIDKVKLFKQKKSFVIEPKLIWIERNKFKQFPKGTASSRVNEAWGLPPTAEDLGEEFKKTEIGQAIMNLIENDNAKKEESEILRNRIRVHGEILRKTEGEEIVEEYMVKTSEIMKDITKNSNQDRNKPSVITPSSGNH